MADDELVAAIELLNLHERGATAALIAHLAELESRGLHHALGFKSLYGYCRRVLHLAEHESYNRMVVARLARRLPVVVPMLDEGLVHLTALRLLAPYLDDENHLALLGGAIHKSKAEVKELVARWFPKPDVTTSIRRVSPRPMAAESGLQVSPAHDVGLFSPCPASNAPAPSGAPAVVPAGGPDESAAAPTKPSDGADSAAPSAPTADSRRRHAAEGGERRVTVDPLSADSYVMRLTARRATIERLRRAQDLLSHAVPDGDVDEILHRALGALIEQEEKRRYGAAARPAAEARAVAPASRTVAARVRRAVVEADEKRCGFVAADGRRCEERRFLEFHHKKPWVVGGAGTAENIALRCRTHNQYEARVYFAPIRAAMAVDREAGVPGIGARRAVEGELVPERVPRKGSREMARAASGSPGREEKQKPGCDRARERGRERGPSPGSTPGRRGRR